VILARSVLTKVTFASASLSAALLNQFFQAKAQFFYIVEMKLSPEIYALALFIWAIWNAINDPLAGWYMDRQTTRWGRRLPWMILFWLPLVISFSLIWSPPITWVGNNLKLFLWLLVILIIFDTSYTVVILAWAALFPEIFTDQKDRNIVAGLRQIFSLGALILSLVIPPFFITDGDILSYKYFGWLLGLISFINLGIAFVGCKEPKYHDTVIVNKNSLLDSLREILSNTSFLAFLLGNLVTYFAYGQVLAMLPFYRKFILGVDQQFEMLAYTSALAITLLSLIFWVWFTSKNEPRFTYLFSAACFGLGLIPMWFVTTGFQAIMIMALVGFGLTGQLIVVDLLLADVVDQDYVNTGTRREGIFFGFNGFFIRLSILLQAISLAVITRLTGFDEYKEVQTRLAKTGIKIQFILLPFLGFAFGFWVIYRYYNLHGRTLKEQRKKVEEMIQHDTADANSK